MSRAKDEVPEGGGSKCDPMAPPLPCTTYYSLPENAQATASRASVWETCGRLRRSGNS